MDDAHPPPEPMFDATREDWLARVAAIGPALEEQAAEADRRRRLTDGAMAALHGRGLFRLLLPRDAGGSEISLPDFFAVVEAIARYDASAAWCVGQGNGCAMLGAYLSPEVTETIWGGDPCAVLAWGPGKVEATVVEGGYRVSGKAAFVSGGHHATWLGAHCATVREPDGSIRLNETGVPENRTVLFPAAAVTLTDSWDVLGLRGTGSDGFTLDDMFVPDERTIVRIRMFETTTDAPTLYRFPQMAIYAIAFSGVALGIARGFMEAFLEMAREKVPRLATAPISDNPVVQDEVARAEAKISAGRAFLVDAMETGWATALSEEGLAIADRVRIRLAATHAIHDAKAAVDTLFDTAGTSGVFATGPFERRLRDIHMVAQQIQGRKTHFRTAGAWMLGHDADLSVM